MVEKIWGAAQSQNLLDSRLYKYKFDEQLLIYAQRPDATACAEMELWNEKNAPVGKSRLQRDRLNPWGGNRQAPLGICF